MAAMHSTTKNKVTSQRRGTHSIMTTSEHRALADPEGRLKLRTFAEAPESAVR
jgi:hypothetical protein